jgi:hypothetical protein
VISVNYTLRKNFLTAQWSPNASSNRDDENIVPPATTSVDDAPSPSGAFHFSFGCLPPGGINLATSLASLLQTPK